MVETQIFTNKQTHADRTPLFGFNPCVWWLRPPLRSVTPEQTSVGSFLAGSRSTSATAVWTSPWTRPSNCPSTSCGRWLSLSDRYDSAGVHSAGVKPPETRWKIHFIVWLINEHEHVPWWWHTVLLPSPPGGPAGSVSADSRAAGVGGDAAENHSDRSSELIGQRRHHVITMATPRIHCSYFPQIWLLKSTKHI